MEQQEGAPVFLALCEGCDGKYTQQVRNAQGKLECFQCHAPYTGPVFN